MKPLTHEQAAATTPVVLGEDQADEETSLRRESVTLADQLRLRKEELAVIEVEWTEFRARYMRSVGRRYAELEEVEAEIEEFQSLRGHIAEATSEERDEVENEAQETSHASVAAGFQPLKQMRKLFRRVAKLFHPDLAGDDRERERRHTLMTEANQAYREGNAERLTSLLEDEHAGQRNEASDAESHARLTALRTHVAHLRRELRSVETEIKRITDTDFYYFKTKAEEVAKHGRDLLSDMEARVAEQITNARRRLDVMRVGAGEN